MSRLYLKQVSPSHEIVLDPYQPWQPGSLPYVYDVRRHVEPYVKEVYPAASERETIGRRYIKIALTAVQLKRVFDRLIDGQVLFPHSFVGSSAVELYTLDIFFAPPIAPRRGELETPEAFTAMMCDRVSNGNAQSEILARRHAVQATQILVYLHRRYTDLMKKPFQPSNDQASEEDKAKEEKMSRTNPIEEMPYINNASPSDLRQGVLSARVLEAAKDNASFFTPLAKEADYGRDVFVQDDWKYDPRSLVHLLDPKRLLGGVFESALFFKTGVTAFPLHDEQLGMHFTHHQIGGFSVWFMIHVNQEDKIRELAFELCEATAKDKAAAAGEERDEEVKEEDRKHVANILYHSKGIMPSLRMLDRHDIKYTIEYLSAGQMIHGRGPHFGIGVGVAPTVSFASNQLDELWLASGIKHIEDYMMWLKKLMLLDEENDLFKKTMKQYNITAESLARALNQHPPDFLCALMEALKQNPDSNPALNTHSAALNAIPRLGSRCKTIQEELHSPLFTKFFNKHYVGQPGYANFQLCQCMRDKSVHQQQCLAASCIIASALTLLVQLFVYRL
jgi:hypothetical protein